MVQISVGEKKYPLLFLSCDVMIAVYLRINIKECLTTVKQVFFSLPTKGSLVDIQAYQPYTLLGHPV